MKIGGAVEAMRQGCKVARSGWNGKNMHVAIAFGDARMTVPYVYMKTADGGLVPWLCSQTDLLAADWEVLGPEEQEAPK
jgi:Protein of unknown function (DUF2829)